MNTTNNNELINFDFIINECSDNPTFIKAYLNIFMSQFEDFLNIIENNEEYNFYIHKISTSVETLKIERVIIILKELRNTSNNSLKKELVQELKNLYYKIRQEIVKKIDSLDVLKE